jgi:hypothetical protein
LDKFDFVKQDNVYKLNVILAWFPKRLNNMSKQNKARHTKAANVTAATSKVPSQKQKEAAKQILYIDRI